MAGSLNSSAERDELEESHEINVVPFIDIILVLLVIFMVAAPLATVDVKVDLPTSNAPQQQRPDKPLYVTVQRDLAVSVGEARAAHAELGAALDRVTGGDKETRIFLRADRTVAYGDLMNVMNLLRMAGYLKIALVGLEGVPPAAQEQTGPPPAQDTADP